MGTNSTRIAESAMQMFVMHVSLAKGQVEFQGIGRCSDWVGASYSAVQADGVSDKIACLKLLRRISHRATLIDKGIRGAQFGEEDSSCQILLETSGPPHAQLLEELPGLWTPVGTNIGARIVSRTDNQKG